MFFVTKEWQYRK